MKSFYALIYMALCIACGFPAMNMFCDRMLTPKWVGAFVITGIIFVTIGMGLMKKSNGIPHFRIWCEAFCISAVLESLYALIPLFTNLDAWHLGLAGTFDNPAGLAFFLCASLPFSCYIYKSEGLQKGERAFYAVSICIVALVLLLTRSRTGLLCLVAYFLMSLWNSAIPKTVWKWRITALSVTICGLLLFSQKSGSTSGRLFILSQTWTLIQEKPWMGYGTGGFNREYMKRQAAYFEAHPDSEAAALADETWHPLNEFANLWVNYGICAPMALFVLLVVLAYILWKRRDRVSRSTGYVLIPLFLFSAFSYPFKYPITWVALILCIIVAGKMLGLNPAQNKRMAVATAVTLWVAALLLLGFTFREISYEKEWGQISRQALKGKSREMMPYYDKLYSHYRNAPDFLYNYATEQFYAGRSQAACHTADECRKLWSKYNLELLTGDICRELGRYGKALTHYQTASYMCPVRFAPLEGMYRTFLILKDSTRADSIARIVQRKPVKVPSHEVKRIKQEVRPLSCNKIGARE